MDMNVAQAPRQGRLIKFNQPIDASSSLVQSCMPRSSGSWVEVLMTLVGRPLDLSQK